VEPYITFSSFLLSKIIFKDHSKKGGQVGVTLLNSRLQVSTIVQIYNIIVLENDSERRWLVTSQSTIY